MSLRPHANRLFTSVAVAALLAVACARDALSPSASSAARITRARDDAPQSAPHFLTAAAGSPPIANPVLSFWAKKGTDAVDTMFYSALPGAKDSTAFLTIRIRARSLATRPDGSPIADGDSVLITLTLVDPVRMIVDCQPSGLRFFADRPATLKMSFLHANQDLNGDGVVDSADLALLNGLHIWRREDATDPWFAQPSEVSLELHEVEADIFGFSGYAVAY